MHLMVLSKQARRFPVKSSEDPDIEMHSAACLSLFCKLLPALYLGHCGLIHKDVPLSDTFFNLSLTSLPCVGWTIGHKHEEQVCKVPNSFVIATVAYL